MRDKRVLVLILLSIMVLNNVLAPGISHAGTFNRRPPFRWDVDPEEWQRLRVILPRLLLIKSIFSIASSTILIVLGISYYNIYRKTGSTFTLGLIILSAALLSYSISSNPLILIVTGLGRIGLSSLLIVPDLFTLLASMVMLYLSQQ
jgi:hypothetical protein